MIDYFNLGASQFSLEEGRWFGFIPASIGLELGVEKAVYQDRSLTWWMNNSFFTYPVGLISSFNYLTTGHEDIDLKQVLGFPENFFLMLDSGGFQIYSSEVGQRQKIKNMYSVKELVSFIRNQGKVVSFILDLPYTLKDAKDFLSFQKKAEKTRKNNILMEELFKAGGKGDGLIYNILQGFNKEELEYWYTMVNRPGVFDGWGVTPKVGSGIFDYIGSLGFLYEKGIQKNLHVLGVGGINNIAMLIYIGRKYIQNVTFDSTSVGMGMKLRKSYTFTEERGIEEEQFGKNYIGHEGSELLCTCPICLELKYVGKFLEDGAVSGRLLLLHNLCNYVACFGYFLVAYDKGEDYYREVVKRLCGKQVLLGMEFFDLLVKQGYDEAVRQYASFFREVGRCKEVSFDDIFLGIGGSDCRRVEGLSTVFDGLEPVKKKFIRPFEKSWIAENRRKGLNQRQVGISGRSCYKKEFEEKICIGICDFVEDCRGEAVLV